MAQHDLVIDNASGAAVRTDIINALAALGSNMKGPSAPPAPTAGMMWWDDDTPSATIWTLKAYDGADWSELGRLNVTTNVFTPADGNIAWADVASAATANLSATSSNVRITGTTAITSFGTADSGILRFIRFAAALTLTHNATSLILPGAANITTAAGDTAIAISLGSGNWVVVNYVRAAGLPVVQMATARVLGRVTAGSGAIEEIALGNAAAALSLGINRGTEQATTSGTAIDFTSIPAGVRRITVTFDSVSFNGSDSASLQLGDSGGIESSGYTGVLGIVTGTSSGTAGSWVGSGIPVIYAGTAAGDNCSGVIHLINQSGNKWSVSGIVARNGTVQIFNTQGWKTLSDTLDRIRFRVDGASSFDAGSVNIMWEF